MSLGELATWQRRRCLPARPWSVPKSGGAPPRRAGWERLAVVAGELGHDFCLVQASREAPAVAEHGASRRIGAGFYRELLRKGAPRRPEARAPVGGGRPAGGGGAAGR